MARALALIILTLAACKGADSTAPDVNDAGTMDASAMDASAIDSGGMDSAFEDASEEDATSADAASGDAGMMPEFVPRAVQTARATEIPPCSVFVDAANRGAADGSAAQPYPTIADAIAGLASGTVVCVAEGTYAEALEPGIKYFTLAGGFQSGQNFAVRDSSVYVSRAQGNGSNIFLNIVDPGPMEGQLTAVDGFEITGYSQGIVRDVYYSQRVDITNNFIHDNTCAQADVIGGGFSLDNASGTIRGNVFARNTCSRGGAGALGDSTNTNAVIIANNLVDSNAGDQPDISHGGGLYLFANDLTVTANEFIGNTVTGWGGGLYIGAFSGGGQQTNAVISWNIYRNNRAGSFGGGFFCDDSARCISSHEIYDSNCAGNIFLDSGPGGSDPTIATFDHLTSYRGLTPDCSAPQAGVLIYKDNLAADAYSFTNSIFWGNEADHDFNAACGVGCANVTVSVTYSDVQTQYMNGGITIDFGAGNVPSVDPLFVDAAAGDFHLQSTQGHWTPTGFVVDAADSPALEVGDPSGIELGAYGDSVEASRGQ
jgi:hypothetical protein